MPTTLMTPGVYIEEKNAFPGSVVAVETAVPVFIGYTQFAERNGKSLTGVPTRITSFAEYTLYFGGAFKPVFTINDAPGAAAATPAAPAADGAAPADAAAAPAAPAAPAKGGIKLKINNKDKVLALKDNNIAYFYNSIRLFYANGGGNCYILSIGTYGDSKEGLQIQAEDIIGSNSNVFESLKKEYEPTLVVVPDMIALGKDCYVSIYSQVLNHCGEMQNRFGIFDLVQQTATDTTDEIVEDFRDLIGIKNLNYGAAYYPWLKTTIVQPSEVTFQNIEIDALDNTAMQALLTEPAVADIINKMTKKLKEKKVNTGRTGSDVLQGRALEEAVNAATLTDDDKKLDANDALHFHQSLKAASPTYVYILQEIAETLNELPPSGAIAGVYSFTDSSRGVWKSPANMSISMVTAPSVNITDKQQEKLNVDVMAGKSINVIRPFPGIGTLIWGARTLDGNSQDWRYVNVRRTIIMIEQSVKLAVRAYVFEPNDNSTWITIKSMINNFLTNLWKQGALAGAAAEQAFDVQIGLGATMTPVDILDGVMRITVKVAIVRPAEFILITFQQQQQVS
jgi:phage tail sheath protein FI